MGTFLGFIILLIIVFSFVKLKIGVAIYLAYLLLVPYMQIHFFGVTFSYNLVNLIFLVAFFVDFRGRHKYRIDYKPLIPFAVLYGGYLIIMLFSSDTPLAYMLEKYRQQVMKIFILTFVMWNVMIQDNTSVKLFRNVCLVCIAIASIYGLFLTQTEGLNPYIMELTDISGGEYNIEYLTRDTGRMFGRITSVFIHPMSFGLFLGLSLVFIYSCIRKVNVYIIAILSLLVLINVFTCGVRSVIAGLAISILFYLLLIRKFKIFAGAAVVMVIIYGVISSIPEMSEYVSSIVDSKSTNIGGSSLELRINQFLGCFDIISNNPLFGKGLIYVVLCNFGFVGVILWFVYVFKMYKYMRSLGSIKEILLPLTLFVFYLSYSCITGEYGYMQVFILFYIIMIGDFYVTKKKFVIKS